MIIVSNRNKSFFPISSLKECFGLIFKLFKNGNYPDAFDCIEQILIQSPKHDMAILSFAYDLYKSLNPKSRFNLYQSRFFDFNILPGSKVLDIGSGHMPFPFATHLADFAVEDNNYGRAGIPFKHIQGKPVYHCDVENMPFEDGEFDFVYCSHVLEHVNSPEKACQELARVGKRGYIETPTKGKDIFLSTVKISNNNWHVECCDDKLIFTKYSEREKEGIGTNILMNMHTNPQTDREKAFSAVIYLKADLFNTMVMWERDIPFEIRGIF